MVQLQSIDNSICQQTAKRPVATRVQPVFLVARAVPVSRVRGYFAGTQITGPDIAASTRRLTLKLSNKLSFETGSRRVQARCHDAAPLRYDGDTAPSHYSGDIAPSYYVAAPRRRATTLTWRRHAMTAPRHRVTTTPTRRPDVSTPTRCRSNTVLSRCDADTAPWRFDTDTAPSRYDIDATAQQHGALALLHDPAP
ncbi:hypothetical protein EDB85DRAFT_1896319 [Lactarius pseudohatsudake]|nr:hypothetical protein EDB85DRAFT_1896319 [Lactarius pseudohatsudake]